MEEIHPLQLQVPARNVTGRSVEAEPVGTKPCPELPPEIHEMIINELDGETEALKQCALACRVYRYGAQKLLFNKLTLDFSPGSNPAQEFLGILEDSPWIGDYVACLSLRSNGHLGEDTDEKDKWVSRVITALPNIVEMDIGWGLPDFRFCMLDRSSQMAIMSTCENLRSLTLAFTEDAPLAIFDHMQRIETLELQDVRFPKDREVLDAKSWTVPYRIKELTLQYVHIEGARMIYPFLKKRRFSKGLLETLSIGLNELNWVTLSQRAYKGILVPAKSNRDYVIRPPSIPSGRRTITSF
ncbi:hypothetical protein D9613_008827 [Agrocybe pediades]|uniref:F-box domain-containing protein n=1 Tax=Agrocybe pediades TaxID=84607 RepID=A0A8H4QSF0_9AGAR|nr:hypothetical protein D9613_008827 [Agrocybe pediades]